MRFFQQLDLFIFEDISETLNDVPAYSAICTSKRPQVIETSNNGISNDNLFFANSKNASKNSFWAVCKFQQIISELKCMILNFDNS